MTDRQLACPDDSIHVDLALDELNGRERARVLAHVLDCPACRQTVHALIQASEQLLLAAPEAEPPAGFESAVLGRLTSQRAPTRRRARVVAVAAVALLVVAAAVLSVVVRPDLVHQGATEVTEAAMITPAGREVGQAWRYQGDPSWVFISVPGWRVWDDAASTPPREYRLRAGLDDGTIVELGTVTFAADSGSWGATTPVDARRIRTLAVVDTTGRLVCTGTF